MSCGSLSASPLRESDNHRGGTSQAALACRPEAKLREVDGMHFDFLKRSAADVARLIDEFASGEGARARPSVLRRTEMRIKACKA